MLNQKNEKDRSYVPEGDVSRTGFSLYEISLARGSSDAFASLLQHKIDPRPAVFRGRSFVLDCINFSDDELQELDFALLQQQAREHGIFLLGLSGVTTQSRADLLAAKNIPIVNSNKAIRIREENLEPRVEIREVEVKVPVEVQVPVEVKVPVPVSTPVQMICRPVRSGETIYAPDSSIMIFGSLGSRARIIASHHVVICGDVNGAELFAGSPRNADDPGYTAGIIYACGHFSPSLISIAGNYQTAEDLDHDAVIGPLQGSDIKIVAYLEGTALRYVKAEKFMPPRAAGPR